MPFTPTPELARPDPTLRGLLRALAARPDTEVHLVSGRPQETLDEWFGDLPIWLHAEHGFVSRDPSIRNWVAAAEFGGSWREPVLAMLREITQRTPGSLVEVKAAALAWHYRMADQETGARRANELRLHLSQLLSNQPVEILAGNRVIEIRPYGVHKGRIVPALAPTGWPRPRSWPSATTAPTRTCSASCRRMPSRSGSGREIPRRGSGWTAWPRFDSCCTRWWTRGWAWVRSGARSDHPCASRPSRFTPATSPDPATGAVTPPIHLTTTFARDAEGALPHGFIYARSDNPTRRELETSLAALEGGETALAFASGMAATAAVFQSMLPGEHVVAPQDAYYGTAKLLREVMAGWGLDSTLVDMSDTHAVAEAVRPETRLIWIETPSNPRLAVTDIPRVSAIARAAGARCVCDNTWATPMLQRPLALGCDAVMHSTTKYLGGHSDLTGGALVLPADDEWAAAPPDAAGRSAARCPPHSTAGC